MNSLLIGTHNPARIEMVRQILRGTGVRVLTLRELGIQHEAEEHGQSTVENARIKACFYFTRAGIPTLAMDGGLHVDRFPPDQQPGVLVKRLPGMGAASDEDVVAYYQRALQAVGGESPGTWTASQALALAEDCVIAHTYTFTVRFTATRFGAIAPGRALDSIMLDPASGRYYSEIPLEERPYYLRTRDFLLGNLTRLASNEG